MQILEFLERPLPPSCERCNGSGMVTKQARDWMPQVCWCGACNGTGIQREPRFLSSRPAAPSHTTNKENG